MEYKILVAHDRSEASELALVWARDLIRATRGSIHVVRVEPLPALPPSPTPGWYSSVPAREEMDAAKESLEEACARYAVLASTEVLVASDIGNAIVDKAREMDASLIAVGTHGRKGVERMLLGSVAERVLRNAPCPVVAVRRP